MSSTTRRRRNQLGVAFPSPVVMLSVIALAMATFAFLATRHQPEIERKVTPVAEQSQAPSATASPTAVATPTKKTPPPIKRAKVYVEVYNNSGIKGLAAETAAKATTAGWQVVGSDNWYGTVPATTVYYPEKLKRAAQMLAIDLGIQRVQPASAPMKLDRLTVILTG